VIPLNQFVVALFALTLACSAVPLHAHNSDVSSATVRVVDDVLHVEVEMSAEAAMALLGIPMGTQGIPADRDSILPPLAKAARDVYRFVADGHVLELRHAVVEFREEDGMAFLLEFSLPVDPTASLEFDAQYLNHLGSYHRAAITLVDARGGVGPGRMLTLEKRRGVLPLPRS
jgi:hypothetical protein